MWWHLDDLFYIYFTNSILDDILISYLYMFYTFIILLNPIFCNIKILLPVATHGYDPSKLKYSEVHMYTGKVATELRCLAKAKQRFYWFSMSTLG